MDELSPAARKLMDLATAEDQPPERAIDESWGMLVSRVESGAPNPSDGHSRMQWGRVVAPAIIVASVLVLLGVTVWMVFPTGDVRVPEVPISRGSRGAPPAPARSTSPAGPRAEAIVDEDAARMLDDAEAALRTDPQRAWSLLVRHAEISTDAASVPRRLALRIHSLCALGRIEAATHETTAFLHRHGDTPYAEHVRTACGAGGAEE